MPSIQRRTHLTLLASMAASALMPSAFAQDSTLRIVVGYPPGGSSDRMARIVAEKLQTRLGSPVIVENRPGAGGRLAAQQIRAGTLGQNVLMVANPAVMVVAPQVFKDNGYDAEKDFVPVSHVNDYEFALAVASAVPVRELNHLLAWLRANPSQANFGVPATGSLPHFFALMIGEKAGVPAQVVGYRGSAPLITDLLGGQVPVAVDTFDGLLPQHEAGKLRILATSGQQRSPMSPNIPTFRESGLNLAAMGWNTFFAPATMPAERVGRYASAIHAIMKETDTRQKFMDAKMIPVAASQAETASMLKAYRAQWAPVVQKSGYQP